MSSIRRVALVLSAVSLVSACSGDDGPTYQRDVRPIVEQKCQGCHVAGGIAPFALATLDDARAHRTDIARVVADRIMPPWPPASGCTDYLFDRSLDETQIATLTSWARGAAAAGNPADYRPLGGAREQLSRVDLAMPMPVAYTPAVSPDEYRCFVLDWPEQSAAYVTGFRARPGRPDIVHHVIAFLAQPEDAAAYEQLDQADPSPGYTCFGGPGGNYGGWLGSWAPGANGEDYPDGTGIKVRPGSKIILQVHYNTLNSEPMPDQTQLELKIDSQVGKEAIMMPFADPSWLSQHTMNIPAGQADVMHEFAFDPSPYWSFLSPFQNDKPVEVYAAALHMHLRGTHTSFTIDRRAGGTECLLDIPNWNFHWQMGYRFVAPKTLQPGDDLHLQCHWNNSQANQPWVGGQQVAPTDLNWGEGSTDEMCLGLIYITQ
jgi:hypothetical protein